MQTTVTLKAKLNEVFLTSIRVIEDYEDVKLDFEVNDGNQDV